ncbi:MAG: cupin domain-containing protein [Candidatus Acidiferrales bacterium]
MTDNYSENATSESILSSTLAHVELELGSIPSKWLLSGDPVTRSKLLGKSQDRLAYVMLWECGAVSYKWHYDKDEAYIVLSGEGFMTDEKGVERRFGPGDVAFFPAGTNATWRHPNHFRKVAVLKDSVWRPLGLALKAWRKLLKMVGLSGEAPFLFLA